MIEAGARYAEGRGVAKDLEKASRLYVEACSRMVDPRGDCGPEVDEAPTREGGSGHPEDAESAEESLEKDEGLGRPALACFRLGALLGAKAGVPKHDAGVTRSFQMACEGGVKEACESLRLPKPCVAGAGGISRGAWEAVAIHPSVPVRVEAGTPVPPESPYGRGKGWTPYFRLFEDDGVGEQVKEVSVVKRPEGDLLQLTISWAGQEEDSDHGTYHLLAQDSGGSFVVRRFVTGQPASRVTGDGTRR